MRKGFGHAFFLVCFTTVLSYAQTDSTYTDTVVIVKPPLIIKREVHVSLSNPKKEESTIDLGVYYNLNKNIAPASQTVAGLIHSTGFQVRYHKGNIEIGTGVGVLNSTIRHDLFSETTSAVNVTNIIKDTLDCYTIIEPKGVTTICHTKDSLVNEQKTVIGTTVTQKTSLISYLQIPLSLGYTFQLRKWYLTPAFQLIYSRRLKGSSEYNGLKDQLWMAGGQLSLGCKLSTHFQLELKANYQSSLSPVYSSLQNQENWSLLGLGLGAYWRF